MPKQSGIGDHLYVSGYDFSGDVGSLGRVGGGPAVQDVTGISQAGYARIGLVRDAEFAFTSFFNTDPGAAHSRLSALPYGSQVLSYCRGEGLGNATAILVGKQVDYALTRAATGELTAEVQVLSSAGASLAWGEQLTPGHRTDTAATSGASVDGLVGSTKGLVAALHVFGFTGTDVTVKVQSSTDNGVGDPWSDVPGATFASVTSGPGSQFIETAPGLAVERYLRVVTATTGGFTSVEFAVQVARGEV